MLASQRLWMSLLWAAAISISSRGSSDSDSGGVINGKGAPHFSPSSICKSKGTNIVPLLFHSLSLSFFQVKY